MALYYQDFHKDKTRLATPKAFVKGGTIDLTKKTVDEKNKGLLYIPTNVKIGNETCEEKNM